MTSSENNEAPSERFIPGPGGTFEPEDEVLPEPAETESSVPEEDDEGAMREQERERREEDLAP